MRSKTIEAILARTRELFKNLPIDQASTRTAVQIFNDAMKTIRNAGEREARSRAKRNGEDVEAAANAFQTRFRAVRSQILEDVDIRNQKLLKHLQGMYSDREKLNVLTDYWIRVVHKHKNFTLLRLYNLYNNLRAQDPPSSTPV